MFHGSFTPRYLKSKINLRWMQVRQWQMCLSPFGIQMCAMFTICLERIKVSLPMDFPCESKVTQASVFNQPEWSQFMVFHKSEVISYCSIWTRNFWLKKRENIEWKEYTAQSYLFSIRHLFATFWRRILIEYGIWLSFFIHNAMYSHVVQNKYSIWMGKKWKCVTRSSQWKNKKKFGISSSFTNS